ncbi:uncharacterized protein UMAG_11599 [Mycosarcoma maydis]|uniref:Uncharacterized protein n=1 Tax=Mycosarcoma maydis TaxID=5270 RepID=A0A0D1DTN7_MYCMD|nr:uncharacterized protein UMAG_11599 [Ustilago maydis 521]KIS65965.1 hypothetical protein UMAG_11599 [Ustilago maydis 521]|eukprot:XP_011392507.1 hypothetical protein UMAG_11599 [Ustilago maydis 521]
MSFSTALQSLRLPVARSVATVHHHRTAVSATSASFSNRKSKITHRSLSSATTSSASQSSRPHAPHGRLDQRTAGPSRCFCTSHRLQKASELPLEELHYQRSLDSYRPAAHEFWQHGDTSQSLVPAAGRSCRTGHHSAVPARSIRDLISDDHHQSSLHNSSYNDFFTSSVRQNTEPDTADSPPPPTAGQDANLRLTYIDSLERPKLEAFENRVRLLIRSGERSLPALCAEIGVCRPEHREQLCCHIMSQCVKQSQDAHIVWDLYRSWTTTRLTDTADSQSTRSVLRRMQGNALYRCATYLQAAGLNRQAATIAADERLKPSQSRYLLERLIYDLKLPSAVNTMQQDFDRETAPFSVPTATIQISTASFAAADSRLTVRKMCDAMINLTADGVTFKRKTVNRMFKLLCLTRARSHVVRLLRVAQRRAQIDSQHLDLKTGARYDGGLRTAGGFSRLRPKTCRLPQVVSSKVMEESLRLLCTQDSSGARTAYEVLVALDASQRTPVMYDTLMTVYGNAPITRTGSTAIDASSISSSNASVGYTKVDEQLWREICTFDHIGGPTLHTMSARIICHARKRRMDLIKSDLNFVRTSKLGSIHDLNENAKLSIVRCCIETGSLLVGFRYASTLLSPAIAAGNERFQSKMIATLLRAAQHIHITLPSTLPTSVSKSSSSSPSRAQLLKRFLRHFSHLYRKMSVLQPDMQTLNLFIQLLDRHQAWIKPSTLWNMLRLIAAYFKQGDQRLINVLEAFVEAFERRDDMCSAQELRGLLSKLRQAQSG